MECPSCHKEITPDAFFCTWCSKFIPSPGKGEKANFFIRWVALVLDPLIAVVLYFLAIATVGVISPALGIAAAVLLPIAYFIWFLSLLRAGRTPGKLLMGLQVVDHQTGDLPGFGKMFLREIIGRVISGIFFGLGYWWALFDKNGQAWHDKLAGTVVLKVSPTTAAELKVALDPPVPVRPDAPHRSLASPEATPSRRGFIPLLVGAGAAIIVAVVAGFLLFRTGTLQVTAQAEAVPRLDGKGGANATWKHLAHTPAGVVTEARARAGTYHLRVDGPHMTRWDSTVAIHAGQTTRIVIPSYGEGGRTGSTEASRHGRTQRSVLVQATGGWDASGFEVETGDTLRFDPAGSVRAEAGRQGWVSESCGPEGWPAQSMEWLEDGPARLLLTSAPRMALIARIGGARPFAVRKPMFLVATRSGQLELAVNEFPDKAGLAQGHFIVEIEAPTRALRP